MVKKYRLSSENNSQKGGNFEIAYINQPSMVGLNTYNPIQQQSLKVDGMKLAPTAIISGDNVKLGIPLNGINMPMNYGIPSMNIQSNSNVATIIKDGKSTIIASPTNSNVIFGMGIGGSKEEKNKQNMDGGAGFGMMLPANNMSITYQNNPIPTSDPSVFISMSKKTGESKVMKEGSEVKVTYREPEIKRSIINMVPTLPGITPSNINFGFPVGLVPTQPIVLNPHESQARLEITSPDSDDVITLSGEHEKIKPIYEKIVNVNKFKKIKKEYDDEKTKPAPDTNLLKQKKDKLIQLIKDIKNNQSLKDIDIFNADNNVKDELLSEAEKTIDLQSLMNNDQVSGIITGLGFTVENFKISKETRKDFLSMLGINPSYFIERSAVGAPVIHIN